MTKPATAVPDNAMVHSRRACNCLALAPISTLPALVANPLAMSKPLPHTAKHEQSNRVSPIEGTNLRTQSTHDRNPPENPKRSSHNSRYSKIAPSEEEQRRWGKRGRYLVGGRASREFAEWLVALDHMYDLHDGGGDGLVAAAPKSGPSCVRKTSLNIHPDRLRSCRAAANAAIAPLAPSSATTGHGNNLNTWNQTAINPTRGPPMAKKKLVPTSAIERINRLLRGARARIGDADTIPPFPPQLWTRRRCSGCAGPYLNPSQSTNF
jgi:hypothetical protein